MANLRVIPENDPFNPRNIEKFQRQIDDATIGADRGLALDNSDITLGNTVSEEETSLAVQRASAGVTSDPFEPTIREDEAVQVAQQGEPLQSMVGFTPEAAQVVGEKSNSVVQRLEQERLTKSKRLNKKERAGIQEKLNNINALERDIDAVEGFITPDLFSTFSRFGADVQSATDIDLGQGELLSTLGGAGGKLLATAFNRARQLQGAGVLSESDVEIAKDTLAGALTEDPKNVFDLLSFLPGVDENQQPAIQEVEGVLNGLRQDIIAGRALLQFQANTGRKEITLEDITGDPNSRSSEAVPILIRKTSEEIGLVVDAELPELTEEQRDFVTLSITQRLFGFNPTAAQRVPFAADLGIPQTRGEDFLKERAKFRSRIPGDIEGRQGVATGNRTFNPDTGLIE